eukprot:COSAG01_NODE_6318_length_3739_cov_2.484341_3_plen_94_part_00
MFSADDSGYAPFSSLEDGLQPRKVLELQLQPKEYDDVRLARQKGLTQSMHNSPSRTHRSEQPGGGHSAPVSVSADQHRTQAQCLAAAAGVSRR